MWCANVKLLNISRSLHEEQTLIKTGRRLHRNLDDADFGKMLDKEIYRLSAPKVLDDVVIELHHICKRILLSLYLPYFIKRPLETAMVSEKARLRSRRHEWRF